MKNIAVFASGNGTNLQAIIDHIHRGKLRARLVLVVSDKKNALALERAGKAGIKTFFADPKKFESKQDYESALVDCLRKEKVDLVVLAGFMRILSPFFIKKYRNKIVNIHPALLPAFKGGRAIRDAYQHGVKVTGVTVHFVDEEVDHGPIILQEPVFVSDTESVCELEEKIHRVEHRIYAQALKKVLGGYLVKRGRRVVNGPLITP